MPADSQRPIMHVRRLRPSDAANIARLERRTYGRAQRAGRRHIAKLLARVEQSDTNLSVGLFRNGTVVGCFIAFRAPDRVELFNKFQVTVPDGTELSGESVYVEDFILDPRVGRYAYTLLERWQGELQRKAGGLPLDAFCEPELLARWKKYERSFRHIGFEFAEAVEVTDLAADMTWYWVTWRACGARVSREPAGCRPTGKKVLEYTGPVAARLQLIQTEQQWLSIRDRWDHLFQQTGDADAFSSFEFLYEWWRQFGVDHNLTILALYRDGEIVGIAPFMTTVRFLLYRYVRELSFIGDNLLMERPGFLLESGDRTAERQLWSGIAAIRHQWDIAVFHEQIPGRPDNSLVDEWARESYATIRSGAGKAPYVINRYKDWDTYLASLGRSTRKAVRRKLRACDDAGRVRVTICEREDCVQALNNYLELERQSWKGSAPDGLLNKRGHVRFYRRLFEAEGGAVQCRFTFLMLDDKPVAATFGLSCNGRYSSLEICHDAAYDHLSPGVVLTALELRHWLSLKDSQEFDFLTGSLENKLQWATAVRLTNDIYVLPDSFYGKLVQRWLLSFKPRLKAGLKNLGVFDTIYSRLRRAN